GAAFDLDVRGPDGGHVGHRDFGGNELLTQSLRFSFCLEPQRIVSLDAKHEVHAALEIEAELEHLAREPLRAFYAEAPRHDRIHTHGREDDENGENCGELPLEVGHIRLL